MARVIGGLIGELRGKLGGQVFSRNGAGQYVRAYVKPIDTRTAGQLRARQIFGNAAASYHHIGDLNKGLWNTYAKNIYRPLAGTNTGQFSGYNAFVALNTVINAGQVRNENLFIQPQTSGYTTETSTYLPIDIPPVQNLSGYMAGVGAVDTLIQPVLGNSQISKDGFYIFNINAGGTGVVPSPNDSFDPNFVDSNGINCGLSFYISDPKLQELVAFENDNFIKLVQTPPFHFINGTDPIRQITISGNVTSFDSIYKSRPIAEDYVRLTAYLNDVNGQQIRIGMQLVKVSPTI